MQHPPLQLETSSGNLQQPPLNQALLSSETIILQLPQHNPQHPVRYSVIHPHQLKEHLSSAEEEEQQQNQQEDFHLEVLPQQLLPPLEVFSVSPLRLLLLDQQHQLQNRCLEVSVNLLHPLRPLL